MSQAEYTLSKKDRKFLAALVFCPAGFIVFAISMFGFYYKGQMEDCRRVSKKLELADWAINEVNKQRDNQKIESMKNSYKNHGIKAEEY